MGEFNMKLTIERIQGLIREVISENKRPSMVLSEMATFASAKTKIESDMKTFGIFSTYRGEKGARENKAMDKMVRDTILTPSGYSWTVVEGGYKETPRDPETDQPIEGAEMTSEIEKSYLIFADETRPGASGVKPLFDVINKACAATKQESFSFGYARTVSDEFEGEKQEMFIAIYPTGAPGPGDSNRIKESWAGPWSSFSEMEHDSGYYTKVRRTKGTFTEEIAALQEALKKTTSSLEKRRLRHKIEILRKMR